MRSIDVVMMQPERHAPVDPVTALREQDAAIASMQGHRTRMLADIAARNEGNEFLPEEIAVELGCSPVTARNRLYQARRLCERLPATVSALCAGKIDWAKARALEEITTPLSTEHAQGVEDWVLSRAGSKPLAAFLACARRRVLRVDPAGAAERARARRTERRVWLRPLDDGMAELGAHLPADVATAAFTRIDQLARQSRVTGDDRTIDAARADAAADLLLAHATGSGAAVRVNVTIDAATLLGLRNNPAELAGYGPLDAATARSLTTDATWRRIITDPASGAILDIGRGHYRPPAALAEHVVRRDATCRFPHCPRPAERCDLDHTHGWQDGGTTAAHNLGALCRRHHRLKHESRWQLEQPTPGHFRWTTPRGTTHTTQPATLTDPDPPHP
ncbi:MAG: DUF222 domain-containing protein, partial [Sciscionella sp.]